MMERERKGGEDRLSALPDTVLIEILSLTPLKTAVATSALSRRWQQLQHLYTLTFYHPKSPSSTEDVDIFWNKCNTIISQLHSPLSGSFTLHLQTTYFIRQWPYLTDSWFRQICSPSIRKFRVTSPDRLYYDYGHTYFLTMPFFAFLFNLQSLEVLELGGCFACTLPPSHTSFHLPNLTKLDIHVLPLQLDLLADLISSTPSIKDLSFWVKHKWDLEKFALDEQQLDVDIISLFCPNLKRLQAYICVRTLRTKVIIDAPALQYLNVTSFSLDSSRFHYVHQPTYLLEAEIKDWTCRTCYNPAYRASIENANVKSVVVEEFKDFSTLTYPNMRTLVFNICCLKDIDKLLPLLQRCPTLEVLKLDLEDYSLNSTAQHRWNTVNFRPEQFFDSVKILELTLNFPLPTDFVKYLLGSMCALEQLNTNFVPAHIYANTKELQHKGLQFFTELLDCQTKLLHCQINFSAASRLSLSGMGKEIIEKLAAE